MITDPTLAVKPLSPESYLVFDEYVIYTYFDGQREYVIYQSVLRATDDERLQDMIYDLVTDYTEMSNIVYETVSEVLGYYEVIPKNV